MEQATFDADLRGAASASWNRFLKIVDPLRPDLYRYCRRLTGNVWDAEDLIQDTLEQAFARLGALQHEVASPRAYVLRIASNLWVDQVRRQALAARNANHPAQAAAHTEDPDSVAVRDAAERLITQLAPQERATVLLKEVFEMRLTEIADVLETSVAAVKAALHRGRTRLQEAQSPVPVPSVSRAVLERFVEHFNARDREAMLALLLDSASIRMAGVDYEIGRDGFDREPGWLYFNMLYEDARWEVVDYLGEPLVLHLPSATREVGSIMRFRTEGEQIAAVRVYAFCPDAVREVAAELNRPAAPLGLYRFDPAMFQHPPASRHD